MGRPKKDPAAVVRAQLAPPADLAPALRRLWHHEFDRFPPGYYVPADVSGMTLYLQTLAEYDACARRATKAKGADAKRDERAELRAIRRQVISLQRALRMFPSTRGTSDSQRVLANEPTKPQAPSDAPNEPAWKSIMRDAGTLKH